MLNDSIPNVLYDLGLLIVKSVVVFISLKTGNVLLCW